MLYEDLVKIDIIRPILPAFKEGRFSMTHEGKVLWKSDKHIDPHTPWIFSKIDADRDCFKWLDVYHEHYRIIPRTCRTCWKVAFQPLTLSELMRVLKLQKDLDMPSKCGIEMRPISGHVGGYSAFWYMPLGGGLNKGRSLYELIEVKLETALGRKVSLILKRGCTEMERSAGRSDKWNEKAKEFDFIEDQLEHWFVESTERTLAMPSNVKVHTQRMWIEWAYQHGDKTYLEYSDSFPGSLVDYSDSKHKDRDFR